MKIEWFFLFLHTFLHLGYFYLQFFKSSSWMLINISSIPPRNTYRKNGVIVYTFL